MIIPPDFWELDVLATPKDDHRLWLSRSVIWPVEGTRPLIKGDMMIYLMLNPSKARGEGVGDPTQRKCNGFAARVGYRRYGLINLFSRSTPYPEELFMFGYEDAIGKYNDEVLGRVLIKAAEMGWPVVAAWGTVSKLPKSELELVQHRIRRVVEYTRGINLKLYCLEATPDGTPRHPLMLGYTDKLLTWDEG